MISNQRPGGWRFRYKWTSSYVHYMGMNIPLNLWRIFKLNFVPLAHQLKMDRQRWDRGAFIWFGCINISKMNVMSHLIYLLQTLLIKLPRDSCRAYGPAFCTSSGQVNLCGFVDPFFPYPQHEEVRDFLTP